MIVYKTAYGVYLTDEFGDPLGGFEELVELVRELKREDYHQPSWIISCPSVEENQFVLGFNSPITKNIDFKAADEKFAQLIARLPQEAKDILKNLDLSEPDLCYMAGDC